MTRIASLLLCCCLTFLAAIAASAGTDPAVVREAIQATRLEPDRAVAIRKLTLETGIGKLRIEQGTIFPATPSGHRMAEMVFVGQARLVLEPPDDIEAGQLEPLRAPTAGSAHLRCQLRGGQAPDPQR